MGIGVQGERPKDEAQAGWPMSELERRSGELERLIADLAARIVAPRMTGFEDVWKKANAVCDRYGIDSFSRDQPKAA